MNTQTDGDTVVNTIPNFMTFGTIGNPILDVSGNTITVKMSTGVAVATVDLRHFHLDFSSFDGISPGAKHHYAKVVFSVGNRRSYKFDVERIVSQEEIDRYPERWKNYRAGNTTVRFDSEEDARQAAFEWFIKSFAGQSRWTMAEREEDSNRYHVVLEI